MTVKIESVCNDAEASIAMTYFDGSTIRVFPAGRQIQVEVGDATGKSTTFKYDRCQVEVFILNDRGKTIDRFRRMTEPDPLGRFRDPHDPLYQGAAVETEPASARQAPQTPPPTKKVVLTGTSDAPSGPPRGRRSPDFLSEI